MELNYKVITKCDNNTYLYGIRYKELRKMEIKNWIYNRPPDMVRIPEIANILEKQNYLDGFIYLVKYGENKYYCYDGIHRLEALKYLYKRNNEFNNKVNHKIIIHLITTYDEYDIKKKFELLNKCVPVPEIYTKATQELNKKNIIEEVVYYLYEKYNSHFSPNKKPNIPNENRDVLMDKLRELINNNEKMNMLKKEQIKKLFELFNNKMKGKQNHLKLTNKQKMKCEKNNCFIFASKNWVKGFELLINNIEEIS